VRARVPEAAEAFAPGRWHANAPMASQMIPLVSGRPGPGERSTASGCRATASSTVS
jgi:hypothetical protein